MAPRDLDGVLSCLYEAAALPDLWPTALGRLARHMEADGAEFLVRDHAARRLAFHASGGRCPGPVPFAEADGRAKADPWWPVLDRAPLLKAVAEHETLPEDRLADSRFHQEVLVPRGDGYRLTMRLRDRAPLSAWLVLHRARAGDPFHQGDGSALQEHGTHLRAVAKLHLKGAHARLRCDAVRAALDRCRYGGFVLDRERRVVVANRAAQQMLAAGLGLALDQDRLCATASTAQSALVRLVQAAAAHSGEDRGVFALHDPGRDEPLVVTVLPLALAQTPWEPRPPLALVIVGPDEVQTERMQEALMGAYRFTPAEARIALDLALGRRLSDMAEERGVKVSTVRTQLASLMHKTGIHHQSELVRLVLTAPFAHFGP